MVLIISFITVDLHTIPTSFDTFPNEQGRWQIPGHDDSIIMLAR